MNDSTPLATAVSILLLISLAGAQAMREPHDDRVYRRLQVQQIVFSPDGQRVAVAYYRGPFNRPGTDWAALVATWDLSDGGRRVLPDACAPVALNGDGQLLAGSYRREQRPTGPMARLALFDLDAPEPRRIFELPEAEPAPAGGAAVKWVNPLAAAFAPDGHVLALDQRGRLVRWPVEEGPAEVLDDISELFKHDLAVHAASNGSMAVSDQGRILAAIEHGGTTPSASVLWGQPPGIRFQRQSHQERPFAYPDASAVHWIDQKGERFVREQMELLLAPQWRRPFSWSRDPIRSVAYSTDLNTIAVGVDRVVHLVRVGGRPARSFIEGGGRMAFSPDGSVLAVADHRGIIRLWDVHSGDLLNVLRLDDADPLTVRVAAVQCPSDFGEPEKNRERLTRLVNQAARQGAQIVVLPETAVSGYLTADLKQTWQAPGRRISNNLAGVDPAGVAETVPGPSTDHFSSLARGLGIYLTVPLLEVDRRTGRYYNTLVLIDPYGSIALHYRKLDPWPWAERSWATPGNLGHPVLDTPYGRLGLLICYDIHQQARAMAELEVDLLLYSIAWVEDAGSDWFEKRLPEIARRSDMAIIGANWSAAEEVEWHGHGQSRVIDRTGAIAAKATGAAGEQIVFADLPLPRENH